MPISLPQEIFSILSNACKVSENRLQLFKDLRASYKSLHRQVISPTTEMQLGSGWLVEEGGCKLGAHN